jgi:proteasome lid subunit RPN8/RPN11
MEENKKTPELIKKPLSFKLLIPKEVESKIRFTCKQIWEVEWSGVLFYTYEGNFEDNDLVLKCVDFYIMDIGNSGYTEFDMSPEVIAYMAENRELLDCQVGLIHSHNNMSTFFSGTDTTTLAIEGTDRNHFLSLIVNNKGDYTAAITRKVKSNKVIKEHITYNTFEDLVAEAVQESTIENEELEYYPLTIEIDKGDFTDLNTRILELKSVQSNKGVKTFNTYKNEPSFKKDLSTLKPAGVKYEQKKFLWEEEENTENAPYLKEEVAKSLALQLLTGSIVIPNESKIDIVKWAKGMPKIFENRFGTLLNFINWAESFVEYLCWFGDKKNIKNLSSDSVTDNDFIASLYAAGILSVLTKLPSNKYIDEYINILESYII